MWFWIFVTGVVVALVVVMLVAGRASQLPDTVQVEEGPESGKNPDDEGG